MAQAPSIPVVYVTPEECDRRRSSTRWPNTVMAAALSALIAVVTGTAFVGWSARTAVEVRAVEIEAVTDRLEQIDQRLIRLEDKIDQLRTP